MTSRSGCTTVVKLNTTHVHSTKAKRLTFSANKLRQFLKIEQYSVQHESMYSKPNWIWSATENYKKCPKCRKDTIVHAGNQWSYSQSHISCNKHQSKLTTEIIVPSSALVQWGKNRKEEAILVGEKTLQPSDSVSLCRLCFTSPEQP